MSQDPKRLLLQPSLTLGSDWGRKAVTGTLRGFAKDDVVLVADNAAKRFFLGRAGRLLKVTDELDDDEDEWLERVRDALLQIGHEDSAKAHLDFRGVLLRKGKVDGLSVGRGGAAVRAAVDLNKLSNRQIENIFRAQRAAIGHNKPDRNSRGHAGEPGGAEAALVDSGEGFEESTAEGAPDATREVYGRLDCPKEVLPKVSFELIVGLAEQASADVDAEAMAIPVGDVELLVDVIASGLELPAGEQWRGHKLQVTEDHPFPSFVLHPTAPMAGNRRIFVAYSMDGRTLGTAVRKLVVRPDGEHAVGSAVAESPVAESPVAESPVAESPVAESPVATSPVGGGGTENTTDADAGEDSGSAVVNLLPKGPGADLEIRILVDPDDYQLSWSFDSPNSEIRALLQQPDPAETRALGSAPDKFALDLIGQIHAQDNSATVYSLLEGSGLAVADLLPSVFVDNVRKAAQVVGGVPNVQLLTEEAYIPWEIAVPEAFFDEPIKAGAPPFLAAQVNLGRWPIGGPSPQLPPPHEQALETVAVLWGRYENTEWKSLPEAAKEAEEIEALFSGERQVASFANVKNVLSSQPAPHVIHFAGHGSFGARDTVDGFVLGDESVLAPAQVRSLLRRSKGSPLIFLNACELGSATATLGMTAGMAPAFLKAGACCVIAPLWAVDDKLAREFALGFYNMLKSGRPVGEVLREAKQMFVEGTDGKAQATWMAYQLFGDPGLRLG